MVFILHVYFMAFFFFLHATLGVKGMYCFLLVHSTRVGVFPTLLLFCTLTLSYNKLLLTVSVSGGLSPARAKLGYAKTFN